MNRATLKVKPETAARLRAAMVTLSSDAGRLLTIDAAINHLLDNYDPDSCQDTDAVWTNLTPEQWEQKFNDLKAKYADYVAKVPLSQWTQAMRDVGAKQLGGGN